MKIQQIGRATLYLADCREVLPLLPAGCAIVTDPQYGAGRFNSTHNTSRKGVGATMLRTDGDFKKSRGDEEDFDPTPWLAFDSAVLWGANHFCDQLPRGHRWLTWDKLDDKTPVPGTSDVEYAWTSAKGPSRTFTHLWRGIMRAGEENVALGGKLHPHQKPVELMKWCIRLQPAAEVIADPYMGSASTGVAALRCGLQFIGCEVDPQHFETACRRLEDEQRQMRLLA
jgi:site-specific DNA-methyltransferase (adenine-specific)